MSSPEADRGASEESSPRVTPVSPPCHPVGATASATPTRVVSFQHDDSSQVTVTWRVGRGGFGLRVEREACGGARRAERVARRFQHEEEGGLRRGASRGAGGVVFSTKKREGVAERGASSVASVCSDGVFFTTTTLGSVDERFGSPNAAARSDDDLGLLG